MSNLYKVLGLQDDATQAEIKSAYKKLAFRYHPDVNQDNPNAEENFKMINSAYQVLSDIDLRNSYDQFVLNKTENNVAQPDYTQTPNTYQNTYQYTPPSHSYNRRISKKKSMLFNLTAFLITALIGYFAWLFGTFMNHFTARSHYNDAMVYFSKGYDSKGYTKLVEALDFNPKYKKAYLMMYKFNMDKNPDFELAIIKMRQAIEQIPNSPILYFNKGLACLKFHKYLDAITAFEKSLSLSPNNTECLFYLGIAQRRIGRLEKACNTWEKAEKAGSYLAKVYLQDYCKYEPNKPYSFDK